MSMHWYVVHTQTGFEHRVEKHMLERARLAGKEEMIVSILVPTENVSEVKDGKKRVTTRNFFPGYVLVQMEMNDDNWYLIRQTPGVTGFVSSAKRPVQVSEEEVAQIMKQTEEKKDRLQPRISFEKGENIKIIEGPFLSFTGVIEEVHPEKGKLKVMVSIFGRLTPVELEYWQVEKI